MNMHIHMHVHIHIHMHIHIHIHIHIHLYTFTYLHIYMFTCLHLHMCTLLHLYFFTYWHIDIFYIFTFWHICICVHVYMCSSSYFQSDHSKLQQIRFFRESVFSNSIDDVSIFLSLGIVYSPIRPSSFNVRRERIVHGEVYQEIERQSRMGERGSRGGWNVRTFINNKLTHISYGYQIMIYLNYWIKIRL